MTDQRLELQRPRPTGGFIVTFAGGCPERDQAAVLREMLGAGVRSFGDTRDGPADFSGEPPAVHLADMGIAFLSEEAGATRGMNDALAGDDRVLSVRPEFHLYALGDVMSPEATVRAPFVDDETSTWGVAAVAALAASGTGEGIKLVVLDTGFDVGHPDYEGREIVTRSFVAGESVQDVQGHGTHVAGTAAGGPARQDGLRYGVAPGARLHIGKVLGDDGSGRERDVQAGMVWGIQSGAAVISMSLGRPTQPGEAPTPDYERLGERALERGTLIVAAAGNESARTHGFIAPVGSPANAVSILAVGAVDEALSVAEFSSGGINPGGGEVNLAAPGVAVLSSVPRPRLYASLRGTSMACPHVAGVAALWAEAEPGLRGRALWDRLVGGAMPLDAPARDVGAGMVQAPGTAGMV